METLTSSTSCVPDIPHKDNKGLWIFGESESKRRVIFFEKKNGSYGFTLQSYGVRYKHGNRETDFITYVNAVEKEGSAYLAGLREGDVILSINGQNMARVEHKSLVSFIRKCPSHLKMIVVSDERARKVELHMRFVHLQKKLQDKMKELEELNWKENEILAGTYRNPCETSQVGDACFAVASSNCCFCRQRTDELTETEQLLSSDETKRQQRSKSVKVSASTSDKYKDCQYSYDFYRKCQSSRELHKDISASSSSSFKLSAPPSKSSSTTCSHSRSLSNKETNPATKTLQNTQQQRAMDRDSVKPKSWDNLMTTKHFGGYGFGFGYGYYPAKEQSQSNCSSHVTHPHHHNHHSHCSYSHSGNPNYYSKKGTTSSKSGISNTSFGTAAAGSSRAPSTSASTSTFKEAAPSKCTTLPTKKTPSTSATPDNFTKMERTLSDSSLNSEHHKDFPKTMSYFKRSGDNVRFSSDEEYESFVKADYVRPQDRDHIFV